MLSVAVWLIYTADHIIDGFKVNGESGILRYDFHYQHRYLVIIISLLLAGFLAYKAYYFRTELFVKNALWLICFLPIYFVLKFLKFLNPTIKMLFVSVVFAVAIALLYNSKNLLFDFFSLEILSIVLLAFINQLVLEHFEYNIDQNIKSEINDVYYEILAKRVFSWLMVVLVIITLLNITAIAYTLSIFIVSFLIIKILKYPDFFKEQLLYRYWADFSLVLIYPILKILLIIQLLLINLF